MARTIEEIKKDMTTEWMKQPAVMSAYGLDGKKAFKDCFSAASLENIVYLELCRRRYTVQIGKTPDGEIDFVAVRQNEKLYVQVTYLLASEETVNREFGAYDSIRDNFPKYVVSLDEFDMSRNGIKHRNIRDFLLAEEWN